MASPSRHCSIGKRGVVGLVNFYRASRLQWEAAFCTLKLFYHQESFFSKSFLSLFSFSADAFLVLQVSSLGVRLRWQHMQCFQLRPMQYLQLRTGTPVSVCFHMLLHWRHLLLCPKHKSCMMAAWWQRRLRHLALKSLRCSNPVLHSTPAWLHLHDCLLNFCFNSTVLPLVL